MTTEELAEAPRYGLSSAWDQEERRLELLETVWDHTTTARLATLVQPGMRCLELGGGRGSIARWLCDAVGSQGSVHATDLDTRWLDALDRPNLTVTRHDLLVDDLPEATFDVIHARAVLEHVADRDTAMARIVRWLAPGGWLYLDDCASFTLASSPSTVYRKAMVAWTEALARTGTSYTWTRTFPEPLARVGLVELGCEVDAPTLQGGSPVAEFWSLTLEYLRPVIVEHGLLDGDGLDAAQARLADPSFWDLSPAFMGAWGRKPQA